MGAISDALQKLCLLFCSCFSRVWLYSVFLDGGVVVVDLVLPSDFSPTQHCQRSWGGTRRFPWSKAHFPHRGDFFSPPKWQTSPSMDQVLPGLSTAHRVVAVQPTSIITHIPFHVYLGKNDHEIPKKIYDLSIPKLVGGHLYNLWLGMT